MASAKKKSVTKTVSKSTAKAAAKPSKLQSLTKMLLGGRKSDAGKKPAKAQAKAAPAKAPVKAAPPAKAIPAKGVPAATAKPAKAAPVAAPVAAAKGKKGSPVLVDSATKNLVSGKSAKAPRTPKLPARLFLETGTLLLGNPDGACREVACENQATTAGYCRAHYIKNWKKIKAKEQILREGRLNQYLDELISKYPDKYIEAVKLDLASEKEFAKVITDLDLDETSDDFDSDAEPMENIIDTIKRDFEDETEAF